MAESYEGNLRAGASLVTRLTFLNSDLSAITDTVDQLISGNVTLERGRDPRRSASVNVANEDGSFTIDEPSFSTPYRVARLERGCLVNGSPVYSPLITGFVAAPRKRSLKSEIVSFDIRSRMRLANRTFPVPRSFAPNTRLRDFTRALCELGGLGTSDDLYDLDDDGRSLDALVSCALTDRISQVLIDTNYAYSLDLTEDGLGRTRQTPFTDPNLAKPVWTFEPGDDAVLIDVERSIQDRDPINRAVVIATGPDHYPIVGEAKNLNPSSPLFWTPDLDLADFFTTASISDQFSVNLLAKLRLIQLGLYEEQVIGTSAVIPFLADGDVVRYNIAGINDKFLLDRVEIPLRGGAMGLASRRAVSFE